MFDIFVEKSHFRVSSVSKRVLVENLSSENQFDLLESEPVDDGTHFHMNGFALRLVLILRQKVTR